MDTVAAANTSDSPKEMKAAIARMLAQMDEMREQIKADDAAIARSHAEYEILRAETQVLREETSWLRRGPTSKPCSSNFWT